MALLFGLLAAAPGAAQSASERVTAATRWRRASRRARTRLRVRPIYPYRHYHSLYPVPYDIEYPGPNGKRECVARLCQRAPPERHGDRAAHALPVGAGLSSVVTKRTLLPSSLLRPNTSLAPFCPRTCGNHTPFAR